MAGWGRSGVAVAAVALVGCCFGAANAGAAKMHLAAEGTHGYRLVVDASSNGRGDRARLVVKRNHSRSLYSLRGKIEVTNKHLALDFGPRGKLAMKFRQRSKSAGANGPCAGSDVLRRGIFVGSFEFHGERGFTDVDVDRVRGEVREGGCLWLPHREVRDRRPAKPDDAVLIGCTPEPAVFLAAFDFDDFTIIEGVSSAERPWAKISRVVFSRDEAAIFTVRRHGTRATVAPGGAWFSGVARYADGRTTGDLTANLPGRGPVALTPGKATLHWSGGLRAPGCLGLGRARIPTP